MACPATSNGFGLEGYGARMKKQSFGLPTTFTVFKILSVALGLAPLLLTSCGGGSTQATPSVISVTITPNMNTVPQGGTQAFFATVQGSSNQAVTWSVQEGAGGSITSAGMYTAPNTPGVYHVVATSQADIATHGAAIVTVPQISISIQAAPTSVITGGTLQFTADITGTINTAVTWTVEEGAAGGTITSTGAYTAPATPGTFHLIATSIADNSKSATITVTVAASSGNFTPTQNMNKVIGIHTATLLPDGRVLMAGGSGGYTEDFDEAGQPDAELYDSVAHLFTTTGSMTSARTWHTATLLPNGKVLIAGGFGVGRDQPPTLNSAEVYDPVTGSFAVAGNMSTARAVHTATLLPNGKVLIAGGGAEGGFGFPTFSSGIPATEVYDPATNSFTPTNEMGTPRYAHTATLLPNGKVLVTGGYATSDIQKQVADALATAEIYDPATGAFTPTGSMATARGGHTATLLLNGKVLIAGGLVNLGSSLCATTTCTGSPDTSVASTAEFYDPATGTFTPTGVMTATREEHTATLLPNGKVLIVGGATASQGTLATAEVYDPATSSFTLVNIMTTPRGTHSSTLLPDGTVLVAGGNTAGGRLDTGHSQPVGSAELFKLLP